MIAPGELLRLGGLGSWELGAGSWENSLGASNGVMETGIQIKTGGIGLHTKGPRQGGNGRFRFGRIGVRWGQKL